MTVAAGGGAGAGAVVAEGAAGEGTAAGAEGDGAAGILGAGVSVVVDGCCALAMPRPLIDIANTAPSSDDVLNGFMGFLPGDALHVIAVHVPAGIKRSESVTTVPFAVKASTRETV